MYILGLNAYHGDSSACIVKDGELIAAVEEERFKRIKHWAGFPSESIQYCLKEAGINLCDLEHVAINTEPNANLFRKIAYTLRSRPDIGFILDRIKNKKKRVSIEEEFYKNFKNDVFKGKVHHVEHHLSHLASTHLVSPFEDSVAVSIDGFGDFSSAAWGAYYGNIIKVDNRVYFPHSLGIFYQAMTQYIGFPNYGDEYKVMGLAPYGKPTYLEQMREIVNTHSDGSFSLNLDFFRHHNEKVEYEWTGGSPVVGELFKADELEKLFGFPMRNRDEELEANHLNIAHSIQAMYEEAFFNILETTHGRYGIDNLSLAGGCAMNSVANGKVYRRSPYKKLYVQSAAGDAGGAIGAAYVVANKIDSSLKRFHMDNAYFGPGFDDSYHEKLIASASSKLKEEGCRIEKIDEEMVLCNRTAEAISNGLVIGWYQGRMEWGPRALGNRSILGDPRRADMKDILNIKIKRRESFRPFAPSILREKVTEWFEEDDDVPFMMQVFNIHKNKRDSIPAVTHVDGSGRLQTVSRDANSKYYNLISSFEKISGIPILLNTSFNENEPVVCRPEEALDCFLRTKMDVLVLGNFFIQRKE